MAVNTSPTLTEILEETLGKTRMEEIERSSYLLRRREIIGRMYSDDQLELAAKSQKKPTEELLEHLKNKYGMGNPAVDAEVAMRMHRMENWPKETLLEYVRVAVLNCDESHYNVMDNQWTFISLQHAFYALQKYHSMGVSQVFEEAGKINKPLSELAKEPG